MTLSALIPQRRPRSELIEDARIRAGAYAVAGALVFYWIVARLWAVPFGIFVKGAVIGGVYSMIAVGIALIYRANRIINFAQGDMGGVPATLAVLLMAVSGWPYLGAIAVGLIGGVLIGVIVEFVIIRRFARAPRLVLTVATIGIAQVLTFVEIIMPRWFNPTTPPHSFPSPFDWSFSIGKVVFHGND